jgi:hypothetical protein
MSVAGNRLASRLDTLGHRMLKDAEGFEILDQWAADSTSDRVVITTANGLYGVDIVLHLSTASRSDTMRGQSQEYTDVSPAPPIPILPVLATRVECNQPTDGNPGI